ncbi:AAA family ATPase [Saccharopolyspora sp. NPDC002686]|uniref:AAA family ATPase n=1 Tax=Saccharopolyspora sp. NPDC002686 TaxID=3154541 RepID=UPI0033214FB5
MSVSKVQDAAPRERLAGQQRVLGKLLSAVDDSQTPLVLLAGAAGSGRTSVLTALSAQLRSQQVPVIRLRATYLDGQTWWGVLNRVNSELNEPAEVTRLLAHLLSEPPSPTQADWLASALGEVLTARGKCVVLIDDAQYVDPATRAVLEPLARRLLDSQVTLVCTIRDHPRPSTWAGHTVASGLVRSRSAAVLRIAPLTAAETTSLLVEKLEARPARRLVEEISRLGTGAPGPMLEVTELYRNVGALCVADGTAHLASRHALPRVPDDSPLLVGVRYLPKSAQQVLMTLAALHPFDGADVALAAEATGISADYVAKVVAAAVSTGLLSLHRGQFGFRPPVLADALASRLMPYARLRAAQVLLNAAQRSSSIDQVPAFVYDRIAEAGLAAGCSKSASLLLQRGIAVLAYEPDRARRWIGAAATHFRGAQRWRALLALAAAHWLAGNWQDAIETITTLKQETPRPLPPDLLLAAEIIQITSLDSLDDTDALNKIVADPADLPADRSAQRIVTVALALHCLGRCSESSQLLESTWSTWTAGGGSTAGTGGFLQHANDFLLGHRTTSAYLEHCQISTAHGDGKADFHTLRTGSELDLLLAAEDLVGARTLLAASDSLPLTGPHKALLCFLSGDWGDQLDDARDDIATNTASAPILAYDTAHRAFAQIEMLRARPSRARDLLDRARGARPKLSHLLDSTESDLLHMLGDRSGAAESLRRGLESAASTGLVLGTDRLWLRLAELSRADGDMAQAQRCAIQCGRVAEKVGSDVARLNHLIAKFTATDDPADAAEALRLSSRLDQPFARAQTVFRLSQLGAASKNEILEAYEIYGSLGALLPRANLRRLMRERKIPVPGRKETVAEQQFVLATLVTEGMSNREIAYLLHDTEKSVESRLSRLFKQSGHRSRVGLATAILTGAFTADVKP